MSSAARREEREVLYGVHAVMEALLARRRSVERVLVAREARGGGLGRLLRVARQAGVPITHLPRSVLGRKVGAAATHQGVAAIVSPVPYAELDDLCRAAAARPDGLLVLLDRLVDPGNLGAALRTAAAAGACGVILAGEGAVGLTAVVAKAAAGALERIPVARAPRPRRLLLRLREAGFSAVALEPRAPTPWEAVDLRGRVVLVAGGEARGVRRALSEVCDGSIAIPLAPGVESLNASVALGVVLFEAVRQRRAGGGPPGGRFFAPRA